RPPQHRRGRGRQRITERRKCLLRFAGELDLANELVERISGRTGEIHLYVAEPEWIRLIAGQEEVEADGRRDGEPHGREVGPAHGDVALAGHADGGAP